MDKSLAHSDFAEYVLEIVLILIGTIVSLVELVFVKNTDLGLVLIVITLIVTTSTLSIRREIQKEEEISSFLKKIPKEWSDDAKTKFDQLKSDCQEWSKGKRAIPKTEMSSYEIRMIKRAHTSLKGYCKATPLTELYIWDNKRGGHFRSIAEAQIVAREGITRRRIFVCKSDELKVDDPIARQIIEEQQKPCSSGGFGFEVRILWHDHLLEFWDTYLIADDREVLALHGTNVDSNTCDVLLESTETKKYVDHFERMWEIATPVDCFLSASKNATSLRD
ncbi:MAG: hypothetical protein ACYCQJ_04015 [Nitrososphaerales archaeon]